MSLHRCSVERDLDQHPRLDVSVHELVQLLEPREERARGRADDKRGLVPHDGLPASVAICLEVEVKAASNSAHQVSVSDQYYKKLTNQPVSKEVLIKKSFEFLLERESNTMILSQFDLPVIQSYFSEYEENIKQRIQS